MVLQSLNARAAFALRAFGLALISWTVFSSSPGPSGSGRGLVIAALLGVGAIGWVTWSLEAYAHRGHSAQLFLLAGAGGLLVAASPKAAGSAFAFVAIVSGGFVLEFRRAILLAAVAILALALSILIYHHGALEFLAYGLGFVASLLAGANGRQAVRRAEQAELLLAQVQRSREEQLRAARLAESARIAREIHDLLAHTLAGLTIQLEATGALLAGGAERSVLAERLRRAHALAREGLEETRRAVGVLRDKNLAVGDALEALLADYRVSAPGAVAELLSDGQVARLDGPAGLAVIRVAQEALTNVRKHAPGAPVRVALEVGEANLELSISDGGPAVSASSDGGGLAASGGGYGLPGMRERAELLGGTLRAGPDGQGWRVRLSLPLADAQSSSPALEAGAV